MARLLLCLLILLIPSKVIAKDWSCTGVLTCFEITCFPTSTAKLSVKMLGDKSYVLFYNPDVPFFATAYDEAGFLTFIARREMPDKSGVYVMGLTIHGNVGFLSTADVSYGKSTQDKEGSWSHEMLACVEETR